MEKGKVGGRIRSFRENAELSLEGLAERTGLTAKFLAAVEEENLYPSLQPLIKIARALGVRLGTFLDDAVSKDPLIVKLAERTEELTTHQDAQTPAMTFHSLGRGKTDRHMEPFFVELKAESADIVDLSSHEGEEFIVVHSGKIEIVHGKETTILEPGDSAYFNSVVPHRVCASGGPASIYAVLYLPQ